MRALALLLLVPALASAHDGHGAPSPVHLHPGEVMGLIALAAVLAFLVARFWKK
jgi:hypothetical protein